jgi:glycolate oxidase FAD binding subunit
VSTEENRNFQTSQNSENSFSPDNELELSKTVKKLYQENLSVEIIGSGSKRRIGKKLKCKKILDLSKLSGVIEYLPEELYIKVKACTPIAEIEALLKKHNQELAFEPLDLGYMFYGKSNKGTASGHVSCNFSGPRRFKVGSIRDHVIGFRAVNGTGDIIKSGGNVVKNVTGYDLCKLICGSFGTLVALTELTFKVLPAKENNNTLAIHELSIKDAITILNKVASSSSDTSGAVFLPLEPKNGNYEQNIEKLFKLNDLQYKGPFTAIRLEGSKTSIQERLANLKKELDLDSKETSNLDTYQSTLFWEKIKNLEFFNNSKNAVLRAVIPPSGCVKLINFLDNKYKYFVDWGGSLVWFEVNNLSNNSLQSIRQFILELNGYLTVIKHPDNQKSLEEVFTIAPGRLNISNDIKKSFDPKRIFNPGKMY